MCQESSHPRLGCPECGDSSAALAVLAPRRIYRCSAPFLQSQRFHGLRDAAEARFSQQLHAQGHWLNQPWELPVPERGGGTACAHGAWQHGLPRGSQADVCRCSSHFLPLHLLLMADLISSSPARMCQGLACYNTSFQCHHLLLSNSSSSF